MPKQKFKKGDKVIIKHDVKLGECEVTNGYDKTDMLRVGGEPVGHYVRINTSKANDQGYHEASLEKVND